MNEASILSVRDLTTAFRKNGQWHNVLNSISFDIPARKTLAVVGESGSGKSVTALSIMQLLNSDRARVEGSIRLGERELVGLDNARMNAIRGSEIAMIFQEPMTSLNPVLTVGRQIGEALRLHRGMSGLEARAEALRMLEKVGIPSASTRLDEYPHNFSGGMRQRVMIAMALACKPRLLIADEPTTALDVTIQAQILDLIKQLQEEEGMSVLFITHDMGVVAEVSDETLVMYRGDIVERNSTAQLFADPVHPYTRRLLSAVPRIGSMAGTTLPRRFELRDENGALVAPELLPAASENKTASQRAPIALDVQNIVKRFPIQRGPLGQISGQVHAIEDVSFAVRAGETLSLVGESGCGKSTTGRVAMRLIEADAGSVIFEGEDLLAAGPGRLRDLRRKIQIVFQDPYASLNPRMRIGNTIAEPILAHRLASRSQAREKAAHLLEQVGLSPDMMTRYPHEFSGGQRQRISIARALALDPNLIVADESVSALDVSVKAQVVNLLMDLQERLNVAYLFISHDMAVVERVSHHVAVMYLGEIVEIGPRAEVFENPQHPYTRRLLEAVPIPDPARRFAHRKLDARELKSPIRPLDYVPPKREYVSVSSEHKFQVVDTHGA